MSKKKATMEVPSKVFIFMLLQLQVFMLAQSQADNFIVHMDVSLMPKPFSDHSSWYSGTLQSISSTVNDQTASSKLVYSYTHAIQGFSATLSPQGLQALQKLPGFVSATKDSVAKVDTTHSSDFLGLNLNSGVRTESNLGQDIIIGLVDTGVWPESESFNDDGMAAVPARWKGECESGQQFASSLCNKKLIGARFFNRGLIANNPGVRIVVNSTRDVEGHGTHTASTAAGNFVSNASYFSYASGTARGIAPRAHVAMYKALWGAQGAYSSDIIAAIDQAIKDGVDLISLSVGFSDAEELHQDPIAIATLSAVEKNIFVSTSAGNGGRFGQLHNGTPWVLTVAAGTIDRGFGAVLHLANGVSITGASLFPANPISDSRLPIVLMDQCDDLNELVKVGQKIVVCEDKNNSLTTQFNIVQHAKVGGGIFITNRTNTDDFLVTGFSFPAIFIRFEDGKTIKHYINNNTQPKAGMEFNKTTFLGTKPAPAVASYSSRGPSVTCRFVLKPDILAPGDLILASWTLNNSVTRTDFNFKPLFSKFNIISGTSMACPHAAGVAALLKAAHPEWSPATIRSALMTSADLTDNTGDRIREIDGELRPASPLAMGAGHINPNKALDPGLVYHATGQDYVNLLCALNYTAQQIQTITRTASNNCSNPSLDLNYPSFIGFFGKNDSKTKEFERTVTNVGTPMSRYRANVTAMEGFRVSVTPNVLIFREKNEKRKFKLRIESLGLRKDDAFGYLRWEEAGGRKHVVRSPIVAAVS